MAESTKACSSMRKVFGLRPQPKQGIRVLPSGMRKHKYILRLGHGAMAFEVAGQHHNSSKLQSLKLKRLVWRWKVDEEKIGMEGLEKGDAQEAPEGLDGAVKPSERQLTEAELEIARKAVQVDDLIESQEKDTAIGKYNEARAELDRYYQDRDLLLKSGDPLRLAKQQKELTENLSKTKDKKVGIDSSLEKASSWSLLHKGRLKKDKESIEQEISSLEEQIAELEETLPKVKDADRYVRSKREDELIKAVQSAKKEIH